MVFKKVFRLFAFAGLWLTAFSAFLSAAVPQGIIYQGTLRKDGAIYTGTVPMKFRITNADGGQEYWTSGSTDVAVSAGLFRYVLGTPAGNFANIDWQTFTPYVEVTVDGNLLPLEPLLSSPYALHALTSVTSAGAKGLFTVTDGDIIISTAVNGSSKGIVFQDGTKQITAGGARAWAFSGNNLYTTNTGGNVGISSDTPSYRLVVSSGAGEAGIMLMVSTGSSSVFQVTGSGGVYANRYYGDGSGLSGVSPADTLGTHIATTTLNMNGNQIINITSLTVTGMSGMNSPRVRFAQNVEISSTTASLYGGLAISTNVYLVPGAKYYGNGSGLTNLPETDPVFTGHVAYGIAAGDISNWNTVYGWGNHQTAGYAKISSAQTFTGINTFSSTASFTAINGVLPGVYISSGLIVANGNMGIGTTNPQARLDVNGGIKLGNTPAIVPAGTMRYAGGLYEGYNGSAWNAMSGAFTIDNSALWMGADDNIYPVKVSSNVAIGSMDAGTSKLRVTGATANNLTNAFLAEDFLLAPLFTIRNDGKVWVGPVTTPAARLEVQAAAGDSYTQIWRDSGGVLKASISDTGVLAADGSFLTGVIHTEADPVFEAQKAAFAKIDSSQTFTGSNTFSSTAAFTAQNDSLPGVYISSGLTVANGNVGIGMSGAAARLDVRGAAGDSPTQIWRDSGGTIISSMSATGVLMASQFIGDGSALTGVSNVDTLGTHLATTTLNMANYDIVGVSTITVSSITSAGAGVVFSTNIFTNGNIISSNFAGSGPRCVYADSSGMLQLAGSACGTGGTGSDNLGNHTLTQNLIVGNYWISHDGSAGGLTVSVSSNVGVGIPVAATRLDVQSAPGDPYTQIWRNSGGNIISSMSAAGVMSAAKFIGDGSSLANVSGSDNLGNHTATTDLNMSENQIINIASEQFGSNIIISSAAAANYGGVYFSTHVYLPPGAKYYGDGSGLTGVSGSTATQNLNMAGYQVLNVSSLSVTGALGIGAAKIRFAQDVEISSADSSAKGGVYVSTHVYLLAGAKYYGDGSALSLPPEADPVFTAQAASYAKLSSSQTFTGSNTFSSTAAFTAQNDSLPGVSISSGLVVSNGNVGMGIVTGNVGIGTLNPQAKLDVNGDIKVGALTGVAGDGKIRFTGTAYQGYYSGAWHDLNGTSTNDNSALWTAGANTVYNTNTSSGVAIGTTDAGNSKLLVIGTTSANTENTFLAKNSGSAPLFIIRNDGTVGVGTLTPAARLEVKGAGSDLYTQIWRNSGGTVISSMSAAGVLMASKFMGDGSALAGSMHNPATADLNMQGYRVINVSTITTSGASVQFTTNVYVGGHAAFGNAATVEVSTAVFMSEIFGNISQDSYVLKAHGKVDNNSGGADTALYGGSFSAATNQEIGNYSFPTLTGVIGNAMQKNAGNLTNAYGVSGIGSQFGGTITNAYGGNFKSIAFGAATPAITNAYGVFAGNSVRDSGAYITNSYAIFASIPDSIGHIDNSYGLYIGDQSGFGTIKSFNLYSKGAASKNYFEGSVGIGVEAPIAQLQISTVAGFSGNMLVISTGNANVIRMTGAGGIYAAKYYGDGSALTGISGGGGGSDNLGNHTATTDLNMQGNKILNVPSITAIGASVQFATNVYVGGHAAFGVGSTLEPVGNIVNIDETFSGGALDLTGDTGLTVNAEIDPAAGSLPNTSLTGAGFTANYENSLAMLIGASGLATASGGAGIVVSTMAGVSGIAVNSNNGNVSNALGGNFIIMAGNPYDGSGTGTVNKAMAVRGWNTLQSPTANITNAYALFAETPMGSNRIANNYGLYINDQSAYGTSSSFNLYSKGATAKNYFEGSVSIGGKIGFPSKTISELKGITPALGEVYYCSDCSPKKLVVSTGTSAGNFADVAGGTFK
ncbi:MAG: hypothetical protein NTX59_14275 [Elusimicrobia bacterium]|nr:hypothetical protein [Elusimicrobiota bacterium]